MTTQSPDSSAFPPTNTVSHPEEITPVVRVANNNKESDRHQRSMLDRVIHRIRQPLELEEIFQATATEVRQLVSADRVAVFRFYPDQNWEGEFVAEDVDPAWDSVMARRVYDHCFGAQFAAEYVKGRSQVVADIHKEGLSECHVEILGEFQVRANLVVPVCLGSELWGLLCIHQCSAPRQWSSAEVEFTIQVAEHFGLAVQQAEYIHRTNVQAGQLQQKLQQEQTLTLVIRKMRQSLELQTIFNAMATEVRQLLSADRVAVFQFYPEQDWEGEFVAEDVAPEWDSVLAKRVYDHCFGEKYAPLYNEGQVQAVADIYAENLSDCHVTILGKFQIRANLVVPVLQGANLWGLLCIHQCSAPRQWAESEIEFIKRVAEPFGFAVQQANLLLEAQYQFNQQKALNQVIGRIRESLDLQTILQTATQEIRQLFNTDRVAVFKFNPGQNWAGEFVAEDKHPDLSSVVAEQVYDHCFGERFAPMYREGQTSAIDDIYKADLQGCHVQILERFQVKANIVVPLLQGEELWGLLCVHQCNTPRNWKTVEVGFVRQIAAHLDVALKQEMYVQQAQQQATRLAEVAERERALERQKILAATIDRIRQSLDIDTIFNTATQESRQLLGVERVAIYRFNGDWSGEFVAESVDEQWSPLVGVAPVVTDTFLMETQGGRYIKNETFAVDNIYEVGHSACHIELLEQFDAKAYAIVPIFQGDRLWGLLAAYHNSTPRHWAPEEIDLLAQLGSQLGVALQQAETLERVQVQAQTIQKSVERQKALARTIDKIRQSLDIEDIFQATTKEVRQLLEVERVAIYRFNQDWSGDYVADSIVDGWNPVHLPHAPLNTMYPQTNAEGRYPRSETFVPISQGEELWGLLVAYQNSQPRYWQEEETQLLAQVGAQLGVALQQAELLKTTKQQTVEITEALENLQHTQTQLIQGEKMAGLGQLVAGVAHEINNPVSFIYGNVPPAQEHVKDLIHLLELYQQQYPNPAQSIVEVIEDIDLDFLLGDLPRLLQSMSLGAERIREIVQSLRTFSRMDEADFKKVDIHSGLDSTLMILNHTLNGSDRYVAIEVVKDYELAAHVECYAGQLNQVFMNILSNAIDALHDRMTKPADQAHPDPGDWKPTIWIETRALDSNWVNICIRDNGPGMSEKTAAKIFNPFFTTKPLGHGTGLGLSISYQIIVERHQGRLQCKSQLEQGTEFSIQIPIHQATKL